MQTYSIRQATEEDRNFAWTVCSQTMREYVEAIWGWDNEWQENRFNKLFQADTWRVIVVNDEDAGAFEIKQSNAELLLSRLYIVPDFQRRGIGTSIVQSLIKKADAEHISLTLDVLKSNTDAKRLYERLGLRVTGDSPERYFMSTPSLNLEY
jgi:ribosomal protein S18 acetylase RimI-like enzyme